MEDHVIAMYCFVDDLLKAKGAKTDKRAKMSDSMILTTALVAAHYFGCNFESARAYMQAHQGVRLLDKSGFTRRLHQLEDTLTALFCSMGQALKQLNTASQYVIDSFR